MKKILCILTCVIAILASCLTVSAVNRSLVNTYTKDGEKKHSGIDVITNCIGSDDAEIQLNSDPQLDAPAEDLFSVCSDYDYMLTYDFKTNDENALYPDIKELQVRIIAPQVGGGRGSTLGRNFRLYYIGTESAPEKIELNTDDSSFIVGKLGRYALYFDEAVYDVTFYSDLPSYDEKGDLIEQEPYAVLKDLKATDTVVFPKVPKKDGYVFTGWKAGSSNGGGYYFVSPQPQTALNPAVYYASWCEEKDYSPFEIQLTADNTITKGKENGQTVTVKLSDGFFDESYEDLFNTENWKLTGTDDITIEKIEFVDSKTVKLTLSGNSKEIYTDGKIGVELYNELIIFEMTGEDGQLITENEKIQLDTDGVKAAWYSTTDTVTFNRQRKSSTGGGHTSSSYSVKFDTNGGSTIATKTVKRNGTIGTVAEPVKEGFTFGGWYTDKSLTKEFDLNTKIVSSITLYAKWVEIPADNTKNEIVLTIGKKDASIFGETRTNDVAPVIRNERTMLPSRFIAESLGASVEWNEEKQLVTIKGKNEKDEDITILITIGAAYSSVNGENIKLDSPAFIENDRTYTPIRFISEQLGANVEWNESEQKITITRKTADNK